MLDLYAELSALILRFERDAVPYALCGGMVLRNLQARGFTNFVLRPEYVFLMAVKPQWI